MSHKVLKEQIEDRTVEGTADVGIRKTDEYKNLECFCSDNPPADDFERNIRGYVFHEDSLIFKSLPYAKDLTLDELSSDFDLEKYEITLIEEGTAIRVFNFKNEWFVTTHRKLDAFKSKWGKDSFGTIFENNIKIKTGLSIPEFLLTLNTELSYIFLVGTTETTRIVSPKCDYVKLLHCFDKNNKITHNSDMEDWYLPKLKFNNVQEVKDYINSLKTPFDNGCGLFFTCEEQEEYYKIFNVEYSNLAKLRNNVASVLFAYLHNVFDDTKRELFRNLYNSYSDDFDLYDQELKIIAEDLLEKYIRRYIKKEKFTVSKYEHNILYHIHGIFLKTMQIENTIRDKKTHIKHENVIEAFKIVPPSNINKIISERKRAKKLESTILENIKT